VKPRFPLYIPTKSRWQNARRLTSKCLDYMNVPYRVVVEKSQYADYCSTVGKDKVLVLDPAYQRDYDTFDDLGDTKSKGPGPARNFIWDHAVSEGYEWHWVMDDNIRHFFRLNRNRKFRCADAMPFICMEDFVLRYSNVAMAGPGYKMFTPKRNKHPPLILNTRIYSCNLIRNDTPYRWRGRYNEDTDLSLRMLKDGWCTVQFNAFQQEKMATQKVKGGNSEAFYDKEGTIAKSQMQVRMHPDVSRMTYRFSRVHHYVDYGPFRKNKLVLRKGVEVEQGVNEYGMALQAKDASAP